MPIAAVFFDIGGVLERVGDIDDVLGAPWRDRLGLDQAEFSARLARVDPDRLNQVGRMSEAGFRERCAAELGLSQAEASAFMADLWDWYCGELDEELMGFARSLASRVRTAIISNSADGARREEVARYAFDTVFDPIIYSHEVGLAKPDPAIFELACARLDLAPEETIFVDDYPGHVQIARELGMHALAHVSTPQTIAAVNAALGG
jgi:HAD superfamily hydrolase (TIGR01509 family)